MLAKQSEMSLLCNKINFFLLSNIVSKSRRLNMTHRLDRLHSHKKKLCTFETLALDQDGLPGVIQEISGPISYVVKLTDGHLINN